MNLFFILLDKCLTMRHALRTYYCLSTSDLATPATLAASPLALFPDAVFVHMHPWISCSIGLLARESRAQPVCKLPVVKAFRKFALTTSLSDRPRQFSNFFMS